MLFWRWGILNMPSVFVVSTYNGLFGIESLGKLRAMDIILTDESREMECSLKPSFLSLNNRWEGKADVYSGKYSKLFTTVNSQDAQGMWGDAQPAMAPGASLSVSQWEAANLRRLCNAHANTHAYTYAHVASLPVWLVSNGPAVVSGHQGFAVWPWSSHLLSQSLHFLIYKTVRHTYTCQAVVLSMNKHRKQLAQVWAGWWFPCCCSIPLYICLAKASEPVGFLE